MKWLTCADGLPRVERVVLLMGLLFAVPGWALAILADPGAVSMAIAGTLVTLIGATAMLVVKVKKW